MVTMGQANRVVLRPVVTERSTALQDQNKYVFEVALNATKGMVKQSVEQLFGVRVLNVNTMRRHGKTRRFGPRLVRSPERKKAIVTLQPGDKITLFEGV